MHSTQNSKLQVPPLGGRGAAFEAIILAGGLGTRLRTIVNDVPKCMAPIHGIPFINFIISYLINEGVTRFILSLGYKSDVVIDYVSKTFKGTDISYVIEDNPLGTGGAIQLACNKVKGSNVLVLNGDTLFNIDIKSFLAFHQSKNADFSAALKEMKDFSRYGSVELAADGSLQAFNEKQFCEKGLINGGIYALKVKSLLDEKLPEAFSFEKDFLEKNIGTKQFYGLPCDYYFIDIGIPEDYTRFINDYNLVLKKNKYKKSPSQSERISGSFFELLFELID